jgi:hypothetical protein
MIVYTFFLHLWRVCFPVFSGFYCAWSLLKLHKTCGNTDAPCEACLQFLQAITSNQARGEKGSIFVRACPGYYSFAPCLQSSSTISVVSIHCEEKPIWIPSQIPESHKPL